MSSTYTGFEEDEATLFTCTMYYACDGVGEDQGEAEEVHAQPCKSCVSFREQMDAVGTVSGEVCAASLLKPEMGGFGNFKSVFILNIVLG